MRQKSVSNQAANILVNGRLAKRSDIIAVAKNHKDSGLGNLDIISKLMTDLGLSKRSASKIIRDLK